MSLRRFNIRGERIIFDDESLDLYRGDMLPDRHAKPAQHRFGFAGLRGPSMIVLNLTHRCNLACDYCFVRNYYPEQLPVMNTETALRALRLLDPSRPPAVSFFGGEPLLNWDVLRAVTEAAMTAWRGKHKPRFHVTTNGTLLDDAKAAWLEARGFSLIVSVDGPADIHDTFRPLRNGEGSFQAVAKALEVLTRHPSLAGRTTLRGTFTAACLRLRDRVEALNSWIQYGAGRGVSVEPASLVAESCARLDDAGEHEFGPDDLPRLRQEYEAVADWYVEGLKAGRKPVFFHYDKMLRRILNREVSATPCGAGWGYMAVGPKGNIYPCHREGRPIGNVFRGREPSEWFDEQERSRWLDLRWYHNERCPSCWARNICGGSCPKDSEDHFGDLRKQHPFACFIRKTWIKQAFWIIAQIGANKLREHLGLSGKVRQCKLS